MKFNLKNFKNVILTCVIALMLVFTGVFAVTLNDLGKTAFATGERASNPAVSYADSNSFGKFRNDYVYLFTDATKVNGFRAGTESTDVTAVKVNSSDAHGSQTNPYVIATYEDWEKLALISTEAGTQTNNKYFVLANDIDFSGKTVHPVTRFNGTFYGTGNALKNITISSWTYTNGTSFLANDGSHSYGAYGLFCATQNVVIADLIVENYNYSEMPDIRGLVVDNQSLMVGGIIGINFNDYALLNCHTIGNMTSSIIYQSFSFAGALMGTSDARCSGNVYRCSSNLDVNVTASSSCAVDVGGILGQTNGLGDNGTGSSLNIYDCATSVNYTTSSGYCFPCNLIGFYRSGNSLNIENIVSSVLNTSTSPYCGTFSGGRQMQTGLLKMFLQVTNVEIHQLHHHIKHYILG